MRRLAARALLPMVFAITLFAPTSASAAVDVFLKMSDVIGGSVTEQGAIDVLSWSWGTSTPATRDALRGGSTHVGPACVQDLTIMKLIDRASPQLVMNGTTGRIAAEAVLTVRRSGLDQPFEVLVLKMRNVLVTSFQLSGSSELPTESVSLRFESMIGEYYRERPNGQPDEPIIFNVGGGSAAICR